MYLFSHCGSLATVYTLCPRFSVLIARPPHGNMAVVYKWFGLVLFFLTCLTVSEARCGGRTVLTDLQGNFSDGPMDYPDNTMCEWLIKGERFIACSVMFCIAKLV